MPKMLLTQEDCEALIGKLCRIEWAGWQDHVGIVSGTSRSDTGVYMIHWTTLYGNPGCVGALNLTYVVFATVATPESVHTEPAPYVYWRDRMHPQYAHYR